MERLALLLVSCLACTGTITNPDPGYWASGEERSVDVRLLNPGPEPWQANVTRLFVEMAGRTSQAVLDRDVAPGESVTASLIGRAPFGVGRYTLAIGAGSLVLVQKRMVVGCSVGGAHLMRGAAAAGELDIILSSDATAEETISAAASNINGYDIAVYSDPALADAVLGAMAGYGPFGQSMMGMIGTLVTDNGLIVMFTDQPYNAFFDAETYGIDAVVVSTTSIDGTPLSTEQMSQTLAHEATHAAQSMAPAAAPFATTPAANAQAFSEQTLQVEGEAEAAAIGLANEQGHPTGFASQQAFNATYDHAIALGYDPATAYDMATAALVAHLEAGALTLGDPASNGDPGTPDGTGDPGGDDDTGGGDTGGGDTGGGDTGGGDGGDGGGGGGE